MEEITSKQTLLISGNMVAIVKLAYLFDIVIIFIMLFTLLHAKHVGHYHYFYLYIKFILYDN